jgi:uncharacterized protein YodC (DUF2158 family)
MSEVFNIGETVRLASGGPVMTVTDGSSGELHCTWFEGGTQKYGVFKPATVRRHTTPTWSVDAP